MRCAARSAAGAAESCGARSHVGKRHLLVGGAHYGDQPSGCAASPTIPGYSISQRTRRTSTTNARTTRPISTKPATRPRYSTRIPGYSILKEQLDPSRAMTIRYRGTAFLKERINLKALKLLESCSRLACHCNALVFLFYRSHVSFDTNNLGELDDAGKI